MTGTLLLAASLTLHAQPPPLALLEVPFISQSEALCGGAAAAMVLRYWGQTGVTAEDFAPLVDRKAGGIRTSDLVGALDERGARTMATAGTRAMAQRELAAGRPVIALIEDRPSIFHYVVIVGWHDRAVIVHDPARTPYVVMQPAEFERRWTVSGNWMLVVAPAKISKEPTTNSQTGPVANTQTEPTTKIQTEPTTNSQTELTARTTSNSERTTNSQNACDSLVSDGVRLAQANDLSGAERVLADAAYQCPGAAPLRELAGVRLLQRRWPEVQDLAGRAVDLDPADTHAWQLLAASRYVSGDAAGALDAWNRTGQPLLDLVTVSGLQRTTHRAVERLVGLSTGGTLEREGFDRAARRLDELPAAMSTRLEYVPRPGGRAEVRAHVAEQPVFPMGRGTWLFMAARTAIAREVVLDVNSLAHGGEQLQANWRFWPNRPRYGVSLATPVASFGILELEGFTERQPFTSAEEPDSERAGARVAIANWASGTLRWTVRSGVDRWTGRGTFGLLGAGARLEGEHAIVGARMDGWIGDDRFALARAAAAWRSAAANRGTVIVARAGIDAATESLPADLWPAGDTGHARVSLLRAHPLLDDGRIDITRIGRVLAHGGGEVRHWFAGPGPLAAGPAILVDVARTMKRFDGASAATDVDVGAGFRVALPGRRGLFRADFAHGLHDGRNAISVAWEAGVF